MKRLVTAMTASAPQRATSRRRPRSIAGGLVEDDTARRRPARAPAVTKPDTRRVVGFVRTSRAAVDAGVTGTLDARRNIVRSGGGGEETKVKSWSVLHGIRDSDSKGIFIPLTDRRGNKQVRPKLESRRGEEEVIVIMLSGTSDVSMFHSKPNGPGRPTKPPEQQMLEAFSLKPKDSM